MRIEPLSRDEISDAINTPLELRGYRSTDDAIDRIFELSQERAYYIQLCAHYGLNEAHFRQITPKDVSTGLRSVLNRLAIERFDNIYNGNAYAVSSENVMVRQLRQADNSRSNICGSQNLRLNL